MKKTLTLRRPVSRRDDDESVSWFLSQPFAGLGLVGQGSLESVIQNIVDAHNEGYQVIMDNIEDAGYTSVSSEVRKAVEEALQE